MSVLIPDFDCLWVLSEYCDRIVKRKVKAVRKDQENAARWEREMLVFNSEREARAFVVRRAASNVVDAEKAAIKAQDKLKRARAREKKLKDSYVVDFGELRGPSGREEGK